jgi:hypothetical protein
MKKIFVLVAAVMFITALAFAEGDTDTTAATPVSEAAPVGEVMPLPELPVAEPAPVAPAVPETMTLKGEIIDNLCAGKQKPEDLAAFLKKHTKKCALKPACVASGYSLYSDGKLSKFDRDSNVKVEEFLGNPKSKLQVIVEAKQIGDELSLVSIKNQE